MIPWNSLVKNLIQDVPFIPLQTYTVTDERKEDQVAVDKQILEAIKARDDKKYMLQYLGSMFSLSNKQYPHKMVF